MFSHRLSTLLRLFGATVILSCLLASAVHAQCPEGYGDLDGDGLVNVTDAQCAINTTLAGLSDEPLPECLAGELIDGDVTNDGVVTVQDISIIIALALDAPLPAAVDANENSCLDTYEAVCGDVVCASDLGEDCLSCSLDCGACPNPCCEPHDTAGCAESAVESCVCDISSFCCDILWDASCAQLAIDFCDPSCGTDTCALQGTINCAQTVGGSTFGGPTVLTEYDCGSGTADGPERVYAFTSSADSGIDVELTTAEGADLSLHVLSGACTGGSCTDESGTKLTIPVLDGETYYLSVDGPLGGQGGFELSVTCAEDCDVAALCGDNECGTVVCAGVAFSCGTCGDGLSCDGTSCVELVIPPGCPGGGSCFSANGSAGCDELVCCATICGDDAFCCDTSWDNTCASSALANVACTEFPAVCGDAICSLGEESSCEEDCPLPVCGDFVCSPPEDFITCPSDCDPLADVCGDGVCGLIEFITCPADCSEGGGCGDGVCDLLEEFLCPEDCTDSEACGDGFCDAIETLTCPEDCSFADVCPGAGSCSAANGSPGCDDAACCEAVCAASPTCCTTVWDDVCASFASLSCL